MLIQVTLDTTNEEHTPILEALRGLLPNSEQPAGPSTPAPAASSRKAPRKAGNTVTEAEAVAKTADEAPSGDEPADDELDQALVDEAVAKATPLLKEGEGGQQKVRDVLAEIGVKRITHMETNAQVRAFIKALA